MPNIRVTAFAGMIPALEDKLLPNENASYAMNCRLHNGKLGPLKKAVLTGLLEAGELGYDPLNDVPFTGLTATQYPTLFRVLSQNALTYSNPTTYPYQTNPRVFAVDSGSVLRGIDYFSVGVQRSLGVPPGPVTQLLGVVPALRSKTLTTRCYCATYVNVFGEESAPGQLSPIINCYEGDVIRLNIIPSFTPSNPNTFNMQTIRIYRTMGEYETGEQLGNKNNTDYHLVIELAYNTSAFEFADDITSDRMPADLLLSREFFMPSPIDVVAIAELESGFFVIAYRDGTIRVSERFLYHAFPLRNQVVLPAWIDSMVSFYDTLFVTCRTGPSYKINIIPKPAGPEIDVQSYSDSYHSTDPRTLVKTNFGALFSSQRGLTALSREKQSVVSQGSINATQWNETFRGSNFYWASGYLVSQGTVGLRNWLMDVPDDISGQTPFGKLTYIDDELWPMNPAAVPYLVQGRNKIHINIQGVRYTWDGLELAPFTPDDAATYVWRSKMFVEPGRTTYAAAKVTFKDRTAGQLGVRFKLYGDGALRFERMVYSDAPFRLPHLYKAMNWMFELSGKAEVHEVHIATSMIELSGEPK